MGDVERRTSLHGVDRAYLPASDDGVNQAIAGTGEMTATSKGKLVDEAGDVGEGQVVVRLTVIGTGVVAILRRRCVAFKRGAGVIERVLPGKGVEQSKPADELLLVFDLE